MTLSLSQRAEEIHLLTCDCSNPNSDHRKWILGKIEFVLRQTREEALEEGYAKGFYENVIKHPDAFTTAKAEAYREAAKVVEEYHRPGIKIDQRSLQEQIRALAFRSCSCDPKSLHAYGPCPESGEGK